MQYVVSACLAGEACRYDGRDNLCVAVQTLVAQGNALPVCPEVLGGLPTPRMACELCPAVLGGYAPLQKKVFNRCGQDMTDAFVLGARKALHLAQEAGCTAAIIKSRSPSCGALAVYDGTFSKKLVAGQGVWAHMLSEAGFTLYTEEKLPLFLK